METVGFPTHQPAWRIMSMQDSSPNGLIRAFEGDPQVFHDVKRLDRAAKEWRWLAWLWLAGAVVLSLPLVVRLLEAISEVNAGNGAGLRSVARAASGLVIIWLILGAVSALYFLLARRIERGQRWAVALALFIAAFAAATTAARLLFLLVKQRFFPTPIVMDAVLIIAHLNLVKTLFHTYRATRRIRHAVSASLEAQEP